MAAMVRVERHERVLVVTIDRIAKRNAINDEVTAGLDDAFNELDDDPDLRAAVLTGGTTVFSAGTDLSAPPAVTVRGGEYGFIRRRRSKPVVAAVEGLALGGGMELALACDLIVAATDAAFGLPESSRGVLATSGALFRAPRALPLNVARELLLLGKSLGADRAHSLGLVNWVVAPGRALPEAIEVANLICRNSPTSVQESMKALDRLFAEADDLGWRATEEGAAVVARSDDAREGVRAFLERRSPEWLGH